MSTHILCIKEKALSGWKPRQTRYLELSDFCFEIFCLDKCNTASVFSFGEQARRVDALLICAYVKVQWFWWNVRKHLNNNCDYIFGRYICGKKKYVKPLELVGFLY